MRSKALGTGQVTGPLLTSPRLNWRLKRELFLRKNRVRYVIGSDRRGPCRPRGGLSGAPFPFTSKTRDPRGSWGDLGGTGASGLNSGASGLNSGAGGLNSGAGGLNSGAGGLNTWICCLNLYGFNAPKLKNTIIMTFWPYKSCETLKSASPKPLGLG